MFYRSLINLGRAFKVVGYAAAYDMRNGSDHRGAFEDWMRRVGSFAVWMIDNEYGKDAS